MGVVHEEVDVCEAMFEEVVEVLGVFYVVGVGVEEVKYC